MCDEFKNISIDNKVHFVKSKNLCFNCLKSWHTPKNCKSKSTCRMCKQRHKTLRNCPTAPSNPELCTQSRLGHGGATSCSVTPLPTAVINIKTAAKKFFPFRTQLDSGSQVTCITEKSREHFGLLSQNADINISGIGGNLSAKSGSLVSLQIIPPLHEAISAIPVVLNSVAKDMPSYSIDSGIFELINGLQ